MVFIYVLFFINKQNLEIDVINLHYDFSEREREGERERERGERERERERERCVKYCWWFIYLK